MKSDSHSKIIFIVGPTAVGKTTLALELARHIPGEIVSCDSMQVYREISVASCKPNLAQRGNIPHHLLDVVSIEDKFDVAHYNQLALVAIAHILEKGKYPIVVGGSGMYVQVLLDGIFEGGKQDPELRNALEKHETAELYNNLKTVDLKAAEKIHANDRRRIIRALEVFAKTKTAISQLQKQRSGLRRQYQTMLFGLDRERAELYQRINFRVEQMFAEGLVEEIEVLKDRCWSVTAKRIIGVEEVFKYLRKEKSFEEIKEMMKMNTRRLAKRQLTWFRKEKHIKWLKISANDTPLDVCKIILQDIQL